MNKRANLVDKYDEITGNRLPAGLAHISKRADDSWFFKDRATEDNLDQYGFKINDTKLTPEQAAIAKQKGWNNYAPGEFDKNDIFHTMGGVADVGNMGYGAYQYAKSFGAAGALPPTLPAKFVPGMAGKAMSYAGRGLSGASRFMGGPAGMLVSPAIEAAGMGKHLYDGTFNQYTDNFKKTRGTYNNDSMIENAYNYVGNNMDGMMNPLTSLTAAVQERDLGYLPGIDANPIFAGGRALSWAMDPANKKTIGGWRQNARKAIGLSDDSQPDMTTAPVPSSLPPQQTSNPTPQSTGNAPQPNLPPANQPVSTPAAPKPNTPSLIPPANKPLPDNKPTNTRPQTPLPGDASTGIGSALNKIGREKEAFFSDIFSLLAKYFNVYKTVPRAKIDRNVMINLKRVMKSSNISGLGYDTGTNTLEVKFKNKSTYRYAGVPRYVYDELRSADSKGGYFHKNVRNNYDYEKMGQFFCV